MTEDTTMPAPSEPVAGPVQRPVRPCCWRWPAMKLRGFEWRYAKRQTRPDAEPMFDKDTVDALEAEAARLRAALAAISTAPYYVSGPYHTDGGWALCELETGRIIHRVPGPNAKFNGSQRDD